MRSDQSIGDVRKQKGYEKFLKKARDYNLNFFDS